LITAGAAAVLVGGTYGGTATFVVVVLVQVGTVTTFVVVVGVVFVIVAVAVEVVPGDWVAVDVVPVVAVLTVVVVCVTVLPPRPVPPVVEVEPVELVGLVAVVLLAVVQPAGEVIVSVTVAREPTAIPASGPSTPPASNAVTNSARDRVSCSFARTSRLRTTIFLIRTSTWSKTPERHASCAASVQDRTHVIGMFAT
jgi:hypothetical protein